MSWEKTAAKELAEEQGITDELDDVEIKDSYIGNSYNIEFPSQEYLVFQDDEDAQNAAYDYAEENLEEWFYDGYPDWAEQFMTPDLVAIREYALSDADSYSQDIDDERALEEAGLEDDHEALQTERDEIEEEEDDKEREMLDLNDELSDAEVEEDEDKAAKLTERIDEMQERIDEIQERVSEIEGEQEELVEQAREKVNEEHYDYVYSEMSNDIVGYLKDNFGYDTKEIRDSGLASYDERAMAEYIVDTDGVAHLLASYDGEEIDLPSGAVAYRTN